MTDFKLRLRDLHFGYAAFSVLAGIDLEIRAGESVGLDGANGSGKTTLFRCITGLEKIAAGEIILNDERIKTEKDFAALRRKVGYSLQNAEDQLIFPTALEDASFGPLNLGLDQDAARARAEETLKLLGIEKLGERLTHELSGGQQKLVALAAVLAMQPRLLLLDEPFNALDSKAAGRVADVIANLDCARIIVAHDSAILDRLCERRLHLENGKLRAI